VTSGVLQGSILGPLLFLLYENHLSESVGNSSIATFADVTENVKTVNNVSDVSSLQEELTNFEENSSKVNLILNAQKCKVLRVTRKHQKIEYPYKLHDAVLESTVYERDLGVWTSSNLTWCKHVEGQCAQSTIMLGYVRRSTLDIKIIFVRCTLYLTLVRSKLCYASQVWVPQSVELPFICDVSYS
jgi:hypothetical protein